VAVAEQQQVIRARAKWVRSSARKARLVTEHLRGRSVPEARTVLAFTQRAVARDVEKVLRSAVANAEANHGLVGDELVVAAAYADEGPTMKRWRPRARGRVARIRKRTCHITIELAQSPAALAAAAEAAAAPPRRRSRAQAKPEAEATPAPAEDKAFEDMTLEEAEAAEAAEAAEESPAEESEE
jgi:ribosomal protein L22